MSVKTLSVAIPNYNHGHLIGRAIESVLAQTRRPDEFVIIDDGSTDNSVQVIESYVEKNPWIRLLRHPANRGPQAAVETGLSALTGDYYYGLAADDTAYPTFFEKAMTMAERYPDAGMIFAQFEAVDPKGNPLFVCGIPYWKEAQYVNPERFLNEYLLRETPTHSLCGPMIYKRRDLDSVGGIRCDTMGNWADTFAARAIGLEHGGCYLPEVMIRWTVNPGSISQGCFHDRKELLAMTDRIAARMRSERFRSVFPEFYVRKWEKGYRRFVIFRTNRVLASLERFAMRLARYRYFGPILRTLFKLYRRFLSAA